MTRRNESLWLGHVSNSGRDGYKVSSALEIEAVRRDSVKAGKYIGRGVKTERGPRSGKKNRIGIDRNRYDKTAGRTTTSTWETVDLGQPLRTADSRRGGGGGRRFIYGRFAA